VAALAACNDLTSLAGGRVAEARERDVAVHAVPSGSVTSIIAPCDVKDTTSPSTSLPMG